MSSHVPPSPLYRGKEGGEASHHDNRGGGEPNNTYWDDYSDFDDEYEAATKFLQGRKRDNDYEEDDEAAFRPPSSARRQESSSVYSGSDLPSLQSYRYNLQPSLKRPSGPDNDIGSDILVPNERQISEGFFVHEKERAEFDYSTLPPMTKMSSSSISNATTSTKRSNNSNGNIVVTNNNSRYNSSSSIIFNATTKSNNSSNIVVANNSNRDHNKSIEEEQKIIGESNSNEGKTRKTLEEEDREFQILKMKYKKNNAARFRAAQNNSPVLTKDDKDLQILKMKAYNNAARVKEAANKTPVPTKEDKDLQILKMKAYNNTARVKAAEAAAAMTNDLPEDKQLHTMKLEAYSNAARVRAAAEAAPEDKELQAIKYKAYNNAARVNTEGRYTNVQHQQRHKDEQLLKLQSYESGGNAPNSNSRPNMVAREPPRIGLGSLAPPSQAPSTPLLDSSSSHSIGQNSKRRIGLQVNGPGAVAVHGIGAREEEDEFDPVNPDNFDTAVEEEKEEEGEEELASLKQPSLAEARSGEDFEAERNDEPGELVSVAPSIGTNSRLDRSQLRVSWQFEEGSAVPTRDLEQNNGGFPCCCCDADNKKRKSVAKYLLVFGSIIIFTVGISVAIFFLLYNTTNNDNNSSTGGLDVDSSTDSGTPTFSPTLAPVTLSSQPSVSPLMWLNLGTVQGNSIGSGGIDFFSKDTLVTLSQFQNSTVVQSHKLSGFGWSPFGDTLSIGESIHVSDSSKRIALVIGDAVEAYEFSLTTGTWTSVGNPIRGRFTPQQVAFSGDGSTIAVSTKQTAILCLAQVYRINNAGVWIPFGKIIRVDAHFEKNPFRIALSSTGNIFLMGYGVGDINMQFSGFSRAFKAPSSSANTWVPIPEGMPNFNGGPAVVITNDEEIIVTAGNGLLSVYAMNGDSIGQPRILKGLDFDATDGQKVPAVPALAVTRYGEDNRLQVAIALRNILEVSDFIGGQWVTREITFVDRALDRESICNSVITSLSYSSPSGGNMKLAIGCQGDGKISIVETML